MSLSEQEFIAKIKGSESFRNKDTSARLFDFLHQATKAKKQLKELDIAEDFFDRKDHFVPGDDTIVRVNIFKLRQLLNAYYLEEGKSDTLRFSIPKRTYALHIEQVTIDEQVTETNSSSGKSDSIFRKGTKLTPRDSFIILLLVLSLISSLWFSIRLKHLKQSEYHPVWSDFSDRELSNSLILGNPLFFQAENLKSGSSLVIRDLTINDPEDPSAKKALANQLEGYEISDLPYPYFSHNSVWALSDVIGAVGNTNPLIIKTKTETTVDDFNRGNIIFISNLNSFGFVRHFLSKTSFKLGETTNNIVLETGETLSAHGKGSDSFTEYGFFAKIPGENGNIITLIGDSNSTGIKGIMNVLSDEISFQNLMQTQDLTPETFPQFFELIVKVEGFNYSALETEIVHFKQIE